MKRILRFEILPCGSAIAESPETEAIRRRIISFQRYPKGWHFGEGEPASAEVVRAALRLLDVVFLYPVSIEAFLTVAGDIVLNCVSDEYSLEISVRDDGRFDLTLEHGIGDQFDVLGDVESAGLPLVHRYLKSLGLLNSRHRCMSSDFSSWTTSPTRRAGSSAGPSSTRTTTPSGEPPWLIITAPCTSPIHYVSVPT